MYVITDALYLPTLAILSLSISALLALVSDLSCYLKHFTAGSLEVTGARQAKVNFTRWVSYKPPAFTGDTSGLDGDDFFVHQYTSYRGNPASCWAHTDTTKAWLASKQTTRAWVRPYQVGHLEAVELHVCVCTTLIVCMIVCVYTCVCVFWMWLASYHSSVYMATP